jgi:hypothetical protein
VTFPENFVFQHTYEIIVVSGMKFWSVRLGTEGSEGDGDVRKTIGGGIITDQHAASRGVRDAARLVFLLGDIVNYVMSILVGGLGLGIGGAGGCAVAGSAWNSRTENIDPVIFRRTLVDVDDVVGIVDAESTPERDINLQFVLGTPMNRTMGQRGDQPTISKGHVSPVCRTTCAIRLPGCVQWAVHFHNFRFPTTRQ